MLKSVTALSAFFILKGKCFMKPIIGVTPLYDSEKDSLWMLPGYIEGLKSAGALPIILPPICDENDIESLFAICSGFLFTGGQDVSPDVYGEEKKPFCGETSKMRDELEKKLIESAVKKDIPVLGICRGLQFINAALGGTLWQDLETELKTQVEHHMSPPYDRAVHTVKICNDSPLKALLGKEELGVNSYHHQAVKTLSPLLKAAAVSKEDGIIEAAFMPNRRFLLAVQWHPEFSFKTDENSRKIFSEFIGAAAKYAESKK